jgi:hypothetical protein
MRSTTWASGLMKIEAYEFAIETNDITVQFFTAMAPAVGGDLGGRAPRESLGGEGSAPGNVLAAFAWRASSYRLTVSRRTPVSASMRR